MADEALELHKEFIREMTLRIEQGGREIVRALETLGAELREDARRHHEEMRDLRSESRAQTNALLRLLDRLDTGGPAAAGT